MEIEHDTSFRSDSNKPSEILSKVIIPKILSQYKDDLRTWRKDATLKLTERGLSSIHESVPMARTSQTTKGRMPTNLRVNQNYNLKPANFFNSKLSSNQNGFTRVNENDPTTFVRRDFPMLLEDTTDARERTMTIEYPLKDYSKTQNMKAAKNKLVALYKNSRNGKSTKSLRA